MTSPDKQQSRWQEIQQIWKIFDSFYEVLRGSILVVLLFAMGAYIFVDKISDFSMNAFTELISVIGTIFILDKLATRRSERERKEELIFQMGSDESITSKEAARLLGLKGWLIDGSLQAANLKEANLQGAKLEGADLQRTVLWGANLQNSNLMSSNLQEADLRANFQKADLSFAKLHKANLAWAELENSDLTYTTFQEASLVCANFRGAKLYAVNLQGADLTSASFIDANCQYLIFDSQTTMPDGSKWTPTVRINRYTNPNHPNFWKPYWVSNHDV